MYGHASETEIHLIKQLEFSIASNAGTIEDLLHLGLLYIEPAHRPEDAVKLFKVILEREPQNVCAIYWLSYCYLYYVMDNSAVEEARSLLEDCLRACKEPSAAINQLLAEVIADLEGPWRQERGLNEEANHSDWVRLQIQLLEYSVQLEPGWVNNRIDLANAYARVGRIGHAIQQLEIAQSNVIRSNQSLDPFEEMYEVLVTGRSAYNASKRIGDQLIELRQRQF